MLLVGFVDHGTITWTCALYALQNATLALLNASLLGCIGCLVFQLFGAASSQSWLAPHLAFLLFLAIGLWLSVNWCAPCQHAPWHQAALYPDQMTPDMIPELYFRNDRFVIQLGTTKPEQQRVEVFGKGDGSAGGTSSESGEQPAATQLKEGRKQQ